ncbi:MAG: hypothetical protein RLZZ244_2444 [Verrucomicrobiota bacterium]|jgi:phosphoribosyl 1,2-cyclic phosphate phosphodiesterase
MGCLKITFLGTGTSQGVPRIACDCEVCLSPDPRDKRTRCSVHVETPETAWVIDTGADFRAQCLREGIRRVEAAVFTHAHTDHIMGFDDLRPFCRPERPMPVYGSAETLAQLRGAFAFAFGLENRFPGYLNPTPEVVSGPFWLGQTEVIPLPIPHGRMTCYGYLLKRRGVPLFAYLTDCKSVPPEVGELVRGVEHLVVDALRERPHPTHMNVAEALEVVERVGPKQAWLTHLCHDVRHAELEPRLPRGVRVAYDGLRLDL